MTEVIQSLLIPLQTRQDRTKNLKWLGSDFSLAHVY